MDTGNPWIQHLIATHKEYMKFCNIDANNSMDLHQCNSEGIQNLYL